MPPMSQDISEPTGGASLRYGDPWASPPEARDPVRRLRGHLVLPVTIWTAGTVEGTEGSERTVDNEPGPEKMPPVGLTVSSVVLSQGAPPMLAGLISPASDFADVLTASAGPLCRAAAGKRPPSPGPARCRRAARPGGAPLQRGRCHTARC